MGHIYLEFSNDFINWELLCFIINMSLSYNFVWLSSMNYRAINREKFQLLKFILNICDSLMNHKTINREKFQLFKSNYKHLWFLWSPNSQIGNLHWESWECFTNSSQTFSLCLCEQCIFLGHCIQSTLSLFQVLSLQLAFHIRNFLGSFLRVSHKPMLRL